MQISLLHLVRANLLVQHLLHIVEIAIQILRMRDRLEVGNKQFLLGIAYDFA